MTYTIELTETQLRLIWKALEEWERLRMGQFGDLADDLASYGYENSKSSADRKQRFDEYIHRRDAANELFESGYKAAYPWVREKTEEMMIAEDMWVAIRYFLWDQKPEPKDYHTVESRRPLGFGSEPILKIEGRGDTE